MLQDLRFAARRLASRPAFTSLMVFTLALGIGANTAVFTIVDQTLFRSAPFAYADRLVDVIGRTKNGGGPTFTPDAIAEWQTHPEVFERFEGYATATFDITDIGEPERVSGDVVTTELFPMLGVSPFVGRPFTAADGHAGGEGVAIIGEGLWRRRFGADPNVIGQVMTLSDRPHAIIGVMSRRFHLEPTGVDVLWVPINVNDPEIPASNFLGSARLRAGSRVDAIQAQANAIAGQLRTARPGWGVELLPRTIARVDDSARHALLILLGAVGLVLLIACANVANLFLVHATGRSREMALRSALGASRSRLAREVLAESLLLSIGGGVAGTLLALWGIDAAVAAAPANMGFLSLPSIEIDNRILAFTAAVSVATGFLFGLIPAVRASRPDVQETLRGSSPGSVRTGAIGRVPSALVIGETAFALMLLVGATLMARTFAKLNAVEPGFDPHGVITAQIALPTDRYPNGAVRNGFFRELTRRLNQTSGISSATVGPSEVSGGGFSWGIDAEGSVATRDPSIFLGNATVGRDYFRTLRIPLFAGRTFADTDVDRDAVILSRSAAQTFWSDEVAVGRRIRFNDTSPWLTVVGVVGDVNAVIARRWNPKFMYFPFTDPLPTTPAPPPPGRRSYVIRSILVRGDTPGLTVQGIKAKVRELDPKQPLERVVLAEESYAAAFGRERFVLLLMSVFSAIAVVLAAAGIFSVLWQAVDQRTREIGVRVALGAGARDIFTMILSRGMALTLVGAAIGIGGALALSRVLTSLLFEVSPFDPVSYVSVATVLVAVGFIACWLPTRRAMPQIQSRLAKSEISDLQSAILRSEIATRPLGAARGRPRNRRAACAESAGRGGVATSASDPSRGASRSLPRWTCPGCREASLAPGKWPEARESLDTPGASARRGTRSRRPCSTNPALPDGSAADSRRLPHTAARRPSSAETSPSGAATSPC